MVEVSSAGDNDAQHLADNKCKGSDTACIKCEELENKLQETLLELSSVKLLNYYKKTYTQLQLQQAQ